MALRKVLHLQVQMCCQTCVDEVEGVLHETHGVASFEIERYNSVVIVTRKPDTSLDKKRLLKRLKRVTHDGSASVIKKTTVKETTVKETAVKKSPGNNTKTETSTVYKGAPSMGPGYRAPWPASAPTSSSMITNPFYFHHIEWCPYCSGYNNIICTTCGRGSHN